MMKIVVFLSSESLQNTKKKSKWSNTLNSKSEASSLNDTLNNSNQAITVTPKNPNSNSSNPPTIILSQKTSNLFNSNLSKKTTTNHLSIYRVLYLCSLLI